MAGGLFQGETIMGKPSGRGILLIKDESIQTGYWKKGVSYGKAQRIGIEGQKIDVEVKESTLEEVITGLDGSVKKMLYDLTKS